MDDNLFAALDRVVEAGGQKVAGKVVAGGLAKKAADALLADLVKHQHLEKQGKAFSLTEGGRHAWEAKAGAARKRELADRRTEAFLAEVAKQKGKALTAKQKQAFDETFIRGMVSQGIVAEAGPGKYVIAAGGQEFLQAREPVAEQLKRLKTATREFLHSPQALLQRLGSDSDQLAEGGEIQTALAGARAEIEGEVARARAGFERALDGLEAFAGLIAAARVLQAALPAALERVEAVAERVRKLEAEVRQKAEQFPEQLAQAQAQMERRAAALEEKVRAEHQAADHKPAEHKPAHAPPPSDEAVWEATRRAYARLEREFKQTSELIKIPKLTDLVLGEIHGLTAARFHDLLQRWQREDRLVLQVCNDPEVEARAAEGIGSPRGLLFYLEMK